MEHLITKIALIGAAGIAAQWLSWRFRLPAIVILSLSGLLLGPVLGLIDPAADFGEFLRPLIAAAVAIILFEGGLTLHFNEIRETSTGVRRLVLIGGPLAFLFGTVAGHYLGDLSWATSSVLGGLFVVTGPTVIMPLLRQARLAQRPASLLRWEAIINDPVGAMLAVLAFETTLVIRYEHGLGDFAISIAIASVVAIVGAWLLGRLLVTIFSRGLVPEYLKVPLILAAVLVAYAATDALMAESGLVAVTVLGITLGNSQIASLDELKRFKETMTVLLVSGVFVLLTATLTMADLQALNWRIAAFIAALLFIVRPASILIATIGSGLKLSERLLLGWIAPRGVVAIAVAGLFGAELAGIGVEDGPMMVPITFAVVFVTVVLHGFTLPWLARHLGLAAELRPGILVVGASEFTKALTDRLREMKIPTLIADRNWSRLRHARLSDTPTYWGEILSEPAEHAVAFNHYDYLIAATDNDAYNALVCTDFGPFFGRTDVFQIGRERDEDSGSSKNMAVTIGGRPLMPSGASYWALEQRLATGWLIQATPLTKEYTFKAYQADRGEGLEIILHVAPDGSIAFGEQARERAEMNRGRILAMVPPAAENEDPKMKKSVRRKAQRESEKPLHARTAAGGRTLREEGGEPAATEGKRDDTSPKEDGA
ncbi:sodium:proton antiporter [Afifella sp. IM 167]|uniref:cation:proton antiporter n=1 Tax=Afifella sp. IM 167 TaxID=2033586 RepID=UPI001CC950AD|nr:sodium:proton antiporter [Afifella sp. IM 167]MBZ8135210.1 sodium:proton exchanger [Afifella sp. IM 167]